MSVEPIVNVSALALAQGAAPYQELAEDRF